MKRNIRRSALALTLLFASAMAGAADAGAFTTSRGTNNTEVQVVGVAGDQFEASGPGIAPVRMNTNIAGLALFGPFSKSTVGKVRIKNLTQTAEPVQFASVFAPGHNVVVSDYRIDPGSQLTLGSQVFALNGGFTTVDTYVEYDPSSPNYGQETGTFRNLAIQATGAAGTIEFVLAGAPAYTLNLASAWANPDHTAGVSTPISLTFAGTLLFNGAASAFTGTFDGMDTFNFDGSTTNRGSISFDTAFGAFSGDISASAMPEIEAVPEPGMWALLVIGLGGLGGALRLRRRQLRLAA